MTTAQKIENEAARIAALPQDQIAPAIVDLVHKSSSDAIAFTLHVLLGGPGQPDEAVAA